MALPCIHFKINVNQCVSGLWKFCRRQKTDVDKLKKETEKLIIKRNHIKRKIEEDKRGSKLTTGDAKRRQDQLVKLEKQVTTIFDDFKRIEFYNNIKIGGWGGNGENTFNIGRFASQITKIRLQAGRVVDHLEVSFRNDRNEVATCGAGGAGGQSNEFELSPGEYIYQMVGCVYEFDNETCISQLQFKTNFGKQRGPFGRGTSDKKFSVPVMDGRIVGFFGQSTKYLNEIGVYLAPN